MEYKGYTAKVEFDEKARVFFGQVLDLKDAITFQGSSVDDLEHEFHESVDDYLEWCEELGREPEKPFSGRVLLRIAPELHREIATRAALAKESLNGWIVHALEQAVTPKPRLARLVSQTTRFHRVFKLERIHASLDRAWIRNAQERIPFGEVTGAAPVRSVEKRFILKGPEDTVDVGPIC